VHVLPPGEIPEGTHVEIEGQFVKAAKGNELHVTAIRKLKPGETMHAADFPEIWEKLQAERAQEKETKAEPVAPPAEREGGVAPSERRAQGRYGELWERACARRVPGSGEDRGVARQRTPTVSQSLTGASSPLRTGLAGRVSPCLHPCNGC